MQDVSCKPEQKLRLEAEADCTAAAKVVTGIFAPVQIDVEGFQTDIPATLVSKAESDGQTDVDTRNRISPFKTVFRHRASEQPLKIYSQVKCLCELMVVEKAKCPIHNARFIVANFSIGSVELLEIAYTSKRSEVISPIPKKVVSHAELAFKEVLAMMVMVMFGRHRQKPTFYTCIEGVGLDALVSEVLNIENCNTVVVFDERCGRCWLLCPVSMNCNVQSERSRKSRCQIKVLHRFPLDKVKNLKT